MKRKVSIIVFLMMSLMIVGCGNSIVKKSIEKAKTAIESKEYDKALASLQLALDEDKENEEANELHLIVGGYQKAKKLVDIHQITEAKEVSDGINSEYINYAIKEDIDSLRSQIDKQLKEVDNAPIVLSEEEKAIIEAQRLCDEGNYDKTMNYIETVIFPNGSNYTEEQQKRVNDILKVVADNWVED